MGRGADLGAIASFGHRDAVVALELGGDRWDALQEPLRDHRLTGVAYAAAESGALAVEGRDACADLRPAQRDAMLWCLELERHLVVVSGALGDAGIRPVLLKGPAFAHALYPDPAWRPFSDIDLLVGSDERARASAVLADAGYRPVRPSPRTGFDDRFGKAVVHRGPADVEVDLHRTLAAGPLAAWIDPSFVLSRTDELPVAGTVVRVLDATGMLLHAAIHAAVGQAVPTRLMDRDVAQAWTMPELDWDAVAWASRRWRLGAVLRAAMQGAAGRLGLPLPSGAAHVVGREPSRFEVRTLRAYSEPGRRHGAPEVALLRAIPGVRDRAAYASSLLVPSREFLAARGRAGGSSTYGRRWALAARRLSRGGDRS
jgi:hypothetical protein